MRIISAVVTVLNEEGSLPQFYARLSKEFLKLHQKYEILFIDDGSTDKSLQTMKGFAKNDKHVKIFSFRRNYGKAEALTLGFQKAKGETIITLDADLQDKPEEVDKLITKMKEGYDLVTGWRKERKDKANMRFISKIWNYFLGILWGVHLHDYNCGLKIYSSECAKSLRLYGGMHRFIPLLAANNGFLITEVPVVHEKRLYGKSKYGFTKIKDLPDMFTMLFVTKYNKRPMHFFGTVGGVFIFIGLIILSYLVIVHFQGQRIGNRPLLIFGALFVLAGIQIGFCGFLADLILLVAPSPQETPIRFSTDKMEEKT